MAVPKVLAIVALLAAVVVSATRPATAIKPIKTKLNPRPEDVSTGSLYEQQSADLAAVTPAASLTCDTIGCPVGGFPCGGSGSQCNIGGCGCMPTTGLSTGACYYNLVYCQKTPGGGGGYYVPYVDRKSSGSAYTARLYSVRLHVVPYQSGTIGWSTCFQRQGASSDGCACLCKMLINAAPWGYSGCQCFYAPSCRT